MYGWNPPPILIFGHTENDSPTVSELLQLRDKTLHQLKQNLTTAQERMKRFADKKRSEINFIIGDWALVKLQPHRQHSVFLHKNQKLSIKYFGPFKVL